MGKKDKSKKKVLTSAGRYDNMTYRDLKKEAIIRGMPFPDVTGAGIGDLISYIESSNNKPDRHLVEAYDDWMDKQLEMVGTKQSPSLRLSYIGEGEDGKPKKKKIKEKKPKKEKRERDENNLYKGTKKSYTFELAKRGFSLERVARRVLKKFPDASEKSIKIWYSAATRGTKKDKKDAKTKKQKKA